MAVASRYALGMGHFDELYRYPERYRTAPFRIAGGLWFVGNADVGAHLIDTGAGLILIDTTYPQTAAMLIESIYEAGFSPKDIKYILHSHGHFDHFGATALLAQISGAKTFLGARDARMFNERPALSMCAMSGYSHFGPFRPDAVMEDGDVIELGAVKIKAVSTPGHTEGVMSFFFDVSEGGRTCRAAMFGGSGFNTLNAEFLDENGFDRDKVRGEFLEGLRRVRNERVDINLGNHTYQNGTLTKRERMLTCPDGPNPFIDEKEWGRFIDDIKSRFDAMVREEG